jgi:hypothetical protein
MHCEDDHWQAVIPPQGPPLEQPQPFQMTEDVFLQKEPPCVHVRARIIENDYCSVFSVQSFSFYRPRGMEESSRERMDENTVNR